MIHLKGDNGFEAVLDPGQVTAYGIDPPGQRRLWVVCDGREYSVTVDVDSQREKIEKAIGGLDRPIPGIRREVDNAPF